MSPKKIYLDYAATSPTKQEVLDAMLPYFTEKYGNPESPHSMGLEAKQAVDDSRKTVAQHLNCKPTEIIFTAGGTESNNIAILGTARSNKHRGKHIITSKIEHSSVLNTFRYLERNENFDVTYLNVDKEGFIDLEELENAIRKDTTLVSIMYANNEIGTIEPIPEIGAICRKHKVLFHTDACQAAGCQNINVDEINVDLFTLNGSKIYGPKGIGALYIKKGIEIEPIIYGGGHEYELRSGTHNVPGIVGLAKALDIAQEVKDAENARLTKMRDKVINTLIEKNPKVGLNGPRENRLPNNINLFVKKSYGKEFVLQLDEMGLCLSAGSACTTHGNQSHVLTAIGSAETNLRISLGKDTTEENIDYLIKSVLKVIN
jgi:cysteine desulfurase